MLGTTVSAGGRLVLRSRNYVSGRAALLSQNRAVAFQGGLSNARSYWWSKPTAASEPATSPVIPEESVAAPSGAATPPSDPVSHVLPPETSDISQVVTDVVSPLQYGDFAALGLTGWSPSGIISWSFELLQVSTGMPWFYTIVAGTLFWRATLIPTSLTSIRNAARLRPYTEQIQALDQQTQAVKDRAAQMEIMLKKQKLLEKAGVSFSSMFLPPIVQVVGNFGLFFALKGMVQLPVAQLAQSGVWFLPDLTLTGSYVMPALMLAVMNVQFSVMKKELDPTKPAMAHVLNIMRVATLATLPMMSWMPAGLWLGMMTSMLVTTAQSCLLRVSRIRQALAIPTVAPTPPVSMRDTAHAILEWYRKVKVDAVAKQAGSQRQPNWTTLPKTSRRAR